MSLVIFAGLPGVGKTTLARRLAIEVRAVHLRADTVEQALRAEGIAEVGGAGYAAIRALARENLRLGHTVICDSVNPWELTREAYRRCARDEGVACLEVEVVCSDPSEHRRRVESRTADLAGHQLPTWDEVVGRDYQPWTSGFDRLVIDTAGATIREAIAAIRRRLPAR